MCALRRGESQPSSALSLELEQMSKRLDGRIDRLELLGIELAQACCEPGGPLRLDRSEHLVSGRRQGEADAALVACDRGTLDESRLLEPRDELGHAGDGHPLDRGELSHADSGARLDLHEQPDLAACDAQGMDLAPQLPVELEQDRAEPVRDLGCVDWGRGSKHFVNQVNNSAGVSAGLTPRPRGKMTRNG